VDATDIRSWPTENGKPNVAGSGDRVKLLVWDGSGLTLVYKRLDEAKFVWPRIEDGVMRLSPGQLGALFEGLDWKRVHSRRVPRPQLAQ
jgi:transposase